MKTNSMNLLAGLVAASLLVVAACSDDDSSDGDSATGGASTGGAATGGASTGGASTSGASTGGAMPLGKDDRPDLGAQIDRVGRPAISTATVATFSDDDDAKGARKDEFNESTPGDGSSFLPDIMGSLAILDALDGDCGNQLVADMGESRYEFLATVLADDQLYVHSDRSECGVYLGLEAEIVGALPEGDGKCGGRTPTDDVIDRSYSVLAAGILSGVGDTIDSDDGDADATTFPFLGAPTN